MTGIVVNVVVRDKEVVIIKVNVGMTVRVDSVVMKAAVLDMRTEMDIGDRYVAVTTMNRTLIVLMQT